MKIFLSSLLFASTILAAPDYLDRRQAARLRPSRPFDPTSTVGIHADDVKGISGTIGDTAWAGAVGSSPSGLAIVSNAFMFEIPQLYIPTSSEDYFVAAAWVGIGGHSYTSGMLQGGVLMELNRTTGYPITNYTAWYSWFPNPPVYLPNDFDISVNDTVWMSVMTTSNSKGLVAIVDLTTHQHKAYFVTSPSKDANLAGLNAEWIVQALEDSTGSQIPLPDFETITFTGCTALAGGLDLSSNGAQLVDILNPDNTFLTHSSLPEDSTVEVEYLLK